MTVNIYNIFRDIKDFGFKNQIQRSSVSIMNNIAERFERKGNKEFKYFLFIAKGSCAETRSMLHLSLQLNYVNKEKYNELNGLSIEISKLLSGLIKTL
ncbi:MAG: four helix bundle protein [Patescibacteria group bacterium]|nr:four helix bundle protein [Patescibacteria group bacterium]